VRSWSVALLLVACLAGCGGDSAEEGESPTVPQAPVGRETGEARFALEALPVRFESPVYVAAAPGRDGDLFVVERAGRVLLLAGGEDPPKPVLDISDDTRTEIEEGLHSIAFHPDFESNGRMFVVHNDAEGDLRVAEYELERSTMAATTPGRDVLVVDRPEGVKWHNGGQLQFDDDGLLYVSIGDAARNPYDQLPNPPSTPDPDNNAQNLDLLFGKIVSVDVDGGEAEPETVAYGLRNAWRFSFDRETGDAYIGDVGQFQWEEVDVLSAGDDEPVNFGWSVYEGAAPFNEHELTDEGRLEWPVLVYSHGEGQLYCPDRGSITGGYVYRGERIPELRGRYVFGDYCSGELWTAKVEDGSASEIEKQPVRVDELVSFGEDGEGELYAVSLDGRVYRLVPA
jgi:glucose/arabinose dehydrogenase